MEIEPFGQRVQAIHQRVRGLYRRVGQETPHHNLLPQAFEELQTALEELQVADLALRQQQQEIEDTRVLAETERQYYQDLFEQAPLAYLVTSLDGTIRKANRASAQMFNTAEKFLVGRPLLVFIPEGERRAFQAELKRLCELRHVQDWEVRLHRQSGGIFDAALTVTTACDRFNKPNALRWLVRDIGERKRAETQRARRLAELERRVTELSAQLATQRAS